MCDRTGRRSSVGVDLATYLFDRRVKIIDSMAILRRDSSSRAMFRENSLKLVIQTLLVESHPANFLRFEKKSILNLRVSRDSVTPEVTNSSGEVITMASRGS